MITITENQKFNKYPLRINSEQCLLFCSFCHYEIRNTILIKTHVEMNHMGDWFCDFCDYENTNYSSWKTHLELNHNISYFAKIFNITFMQGTKIQHTASTLVQVLVINMQNQT